MVKIGFICEGKTEAIFLSSQNFIQFLQSKNIELVSVFDAKGNGNLLPKNISEYITALEKKGAEKILILTDLDEDACITVTKQRLQARPQDIVVIAVKQFEAWLLASTPAMRLLLSDAAFIFDKPEEENVPFDTIRNLMIQKTGRGINKVVGGKIKLTNIFLSLGLDISQAAAHPNCPSAAYFIKKLNELAS